MSEVALTPDEVDDYARSKVDRILVSTRSNTPDTLHIMSDEQWMEPACSTRAKHGWVDKSVALYPRHYRPFCAKCVEEMFGVEVIDDE